jgi:hypothetical protein
MGLGPLGGVRGFRLNPDIVADIPDLDQVQVEVVRRRASRARRRHRPTRALQSAQHRLSDRRRKAASSARAGRVRALILAAVFLATAAAQLECEGGLS